MQRFILRRFLNAILALIGVTLVVFVFSRGLGDPRSIYLQAFGQGYGLTEETWELLGKQLNLDKPLIVQYGLWLKNIVKGDLGVDLLDKETIASKIKKRFPITAKLAITAWLLAIVVGVPLGILSATIRGSFGDLLARGFALLGQAVPPFWIGIVGILIFSVHLHWLPSSLPGQGFAIRNLVLPALTLGLAASAGFMRLTRSAMLEVLDSEYIKFARAKGVGYWKVIFKHALKNALIPPLTLAGLLLAGFINGAIVVEVVFAWPGLGRLAVEAVYHNNFPVLAGVTLLFSTVFIVMNLLVDISYAYIDPRIRYA